MKIVNIRNYQTPDKLTESFGDKWVYVGREAEGFAGSPLGNPFTVEEYGRERAIELYRNWLDDELERLGGGFADGAEEDVIYKALMALEDDSVLVCWCAPEACHSEVIAECSDWLRRVARMSLDERNADWIKLARGGRSNRQELRIHKELGERHRQSVNEEDQTG